MVLRSSSSGKEPQTNFFDRCVYSLASDIFNALATQTEQGNKSMQYL